MASEKGYFYERTKKRFFFFVLFLFCLFCYCCFLELSENGINFDISSTLLRACFAILCSNIGTR